MVGLDWPAIDAAHRMGLDTVVICSSKAWKNSFRSHTGELSPLLVEDQSVIDHCLSALSLAGLDPKSFNGVYTTDEFSIGTADRLAELAGTPRMTSNGSVIQFRDKAVQKMALSSSTVRTAGAVHVDDILAFDPSSLDWSAPHVLKPVASAGTMHTAKVSSPEEFSGAVDRIRGTRAGDLNYVVEEFIDGDEWIADGIIFNGMIEFLSFSRYGEPCLDSLGGGRAMTMQKLDHAKHRVDVERLTPFVQEALAALGAMNGAFHMEFFYLPGEGTAIFGECGIRRGGAFTYEQLLAKYSFNIVEAALKCCLGEPPDCTAVSTPAAVGTTQLLNVPGTLLAAPSYRDIEAQPGVEFARVFSPPGTVIAHGEGHGTHIRSAEALVVCRSDIELEARFASLQDWYHNASLVVPATDDIAQLRQWQRKHFPESAAGDRTYVGPGLVE
jgi:biotin carboxylase